MSDNDVMSWIRDAIADLKTSMMASQTTMMANQTELKNSIDKINDKLDVSNAMLIRHDGCIVGLQKDMTEKDLEIDNLKKTVAQHSDDLLKMKTEKETAMRDAEQESKDKEKVLDKRLAVLTWRVTLISVILFIVAEWPHILTTLKSFVHVP